jgi:glycosyltransferase involved in cell wall biosynthesis
MNYIFVITNLAGGGAERAMLNLATLLTQRGNEVDMILLEGRIEHSVPDATKMYVVTPSGRKLGHGWLHKRLAAWRLARIWCKLDAKKSIHLTVSTLPFCDEVVRRARLPKTCFRIANTLSAEIDRLALRSRSKAQRRLERYRHIYDNQKLVAVSEGVATDLRDRLHLQADIEVIYNPFDFDRIRRLAREPVDDLPARPYIIHAGRYVPQKRHDLLLDAWKLSGLDMDLVLLCDRDAGLARQIEDRGLSGRVTVAGFRNNPYPWIAKAEMLVLCSDHEGMPNVLVEALICGTRVVSTDCPSGPSEVLTGELERWLVPCGDVQTLAAAMRKALSSPRPSLPQDFAKFSAETTALAYETLAQEGG